MTNTTNFQPSRRAFMLGLTLSTAAAITYSDLIPAAAAEVPGYAFAPGKGAPIVLADTPYNAQDHWLGYTVPIYSGQSPWRVLRHGSLPTSFTITNTSNQPIVNPTGTLALQMRDTGMDIPSVGGASKTRANSSNNAVLFKDQGTNQHGARLYTWTYRNITLKPGQSLEIPLRYYVNYPFSNVDYELLVTATFSSIMSTTAAVGVVPGFTRWLFWD
ncbi:hypothetical protein [Rothia sp. ZJ932]|uniref:hypothetical protein n=1 Tax=Rothia sp. ZJ932 TaxID=2810516 RepID=UPI001967051A|nr:hypothetical protein [Rothia sp. ZJ932]QRZ61610.1 hypothetical protein JR346_00185 [Rothia sp. ZJ932]